MWRKDRKECRVETGTRLVNPCGNRTITEKRSSNLCRLINLRRETGRPIVCSRYAETVGVPAIFGREFFGELMQLGEHGAKRLLLSHPDQSAQISLPEAELDIDEEADIEGLDSGKPRLIFTCSKQP